ncbi:MAG: hypothetical protein QM660_10785 [Dysgonomonas sp.]
MIILYSKDGLTQKAEIHKFSYTGTFMGDAFLTATISSDQPIAFADGDYCMYRGEKFVLSYDPAKEKQARRGTYGEAFVYDSIKFNSLADELTRVEFKDIVLPNSGIHYTSMPEFSFYASSVQDLADRIKANLDRIFKGTEAWTVNVSPDLTPVEKNITVSNIKVSEALQLANSQFGANYIIRGRTITIGTAGMAVGRVFGYGKGNGLYDIQQITNQDAAIITRLSAYGSTRNLPNRYYNKLKDSNGDPYISEALWIPNLMLPSFPYTESDPSKIFIDSPNISKYGIREGSVYFDQEDNEIYPSIEGMTAQQLADAGITVSLPSGDNGIINECLGAENPIDNGLVPEEGSGEIDGQFTIYLKDLGFDLSEKNSDGQYKYAASDTMQISMKTGMCAARTFDVIDNGITKDVSLGYTRFKVECNRFTDDSISGGTSFPNNQFQIAAGDKFIILGIELPEVYVKTAAQRLLIAANEYLSQNDETKYTYTPKIDEIFMANHPELGASLKEGDIFNFTDTDLDIDASVIIQSLRINEGDKLIPTYEVTLSNDRIAGTIEKMQNAINTIASNQTGITIDQVKSLVQSIGTRYFLSKISDDTANGNMSFLQNVSIVKDLLVKQNITSEGKVISNQFGNETFTSGQFGSGFRAWLAANGQSYAEFDNLMIRREMIVNVLTIAEIKSVGGQILLSLANMYCSGVVDEGTSWKCTFNTDNGTIPNQFAVDDQVICRKFNSQSIKYYWARIIAVGDDYIRISKTDKDGSGVPAIGDEIIQFGNRTNTARQSAILLSAYGSDAPSIKQYTGINTYDLTGKEVTVISPSGNKFKGDFIIQSTGKDVVSSIDDAVNKIKIGSVNLIIRTGEISDRIINTSGAISEYQGSSLMADYIPVIEGDYLCFSQIKDPSQSDNYFRYAFYQSDKTTLVIRKASDLVAFQETVPSGAHWLRISYPTKNKVQVESGNKVTDWKESPVDTQNKISTAQAIASQVQSDLIITNQQVSTKVSQSDFNLLGNRVSAAESSITINADNITSVVEKVNNINAERRNLIIRNNEQPNFMVGTNGLPTYLWGSNIMLDYIPVVAGSTLTFSQIKDPSQSDNYFRYAFFASDQTTLISRQASDQTIFTVTTPANSAYLRVSYPSLNKVKIELGNSATTWSLSPEDTQAQILAAQTSANNAQSTADIKNRTYYQDTQPTAPSGGFRTGDLWYMNSLVDFDGNINTDTSKNIYQHQRRWNGTTWERINWSASRSKITQTDSSISQLVEKTGINSLGTGETLKSLIDQTPSKIELAVTSLKIGGRNILPISYLTNIANTTQNSFTIQGWARSAMSNTNVKKIFKTNTKYTYSVKYTLTAVSSLAVASRLIGFNLYSSSTGSLEFASNTSLTIVGSTITVTGSFTTPANLADKELVYYSQRFTDGSTSQMGIVKVEDFIITEGDKVGTWTPAVEDTQSQIDSKTTLNEVASSLTITDNKISLASKTIELDGTTIAKAIQAQSLDVGNGNFHVGTDGKISAKGATISGLYRTADSGQRIEIDPINRSISLIDDSEIVKSIWYFDPNLRTAIEFPNFNSSGVKVSYVSIGNNGVNLAGVPLTVQGSTIHFVGLPTTKPSGTNQLWRDGDVLKVT